MINAKKWVHDLETWKDGSQKKWTSASFLASSIISLEYYQTTVESFGKKSERLIPSYSISEAIGSCSDRQHYLHLQHYLAHIYSMGRTYANIFFLEYHKLMIYLALHVHWCTDLLHHMPHMPKKNCAVRQQAPLLPLPVISVPFQSIVMDIVGTLEKSRAPVHPRHQKLWQGVLRFSLFDPLHHPRSSTPSSSCSPGWGYQMKSSQIKWPISRQDWWRYCIDS